MIMTIAKAWYDRHGRRHNFEIESDREAFIYQRTCPNSRYPTNRVVMNNVSQNVEYYCYSRKSHGNRHSIKSFFTNENGFFDDDQLNFRERWSSSIVP